MIYKIYQTFYDKLPASLEDILPVYDGCKIVTCLNPYYFVKLKDSDYAVYNKFDYIASDGIGPIVFNKLFGHAKSVRLSFDMSSMAGPVFRDAISHDEKVFILGAKPEEVAKSVETIQNNFTGLKIAGFHHGYIKGQEDDIADLIIQSGAKICVIGMGAPYQDSMAVRIKERGFVGSIYTCGGFIHQTTEGIVSFPEWSNKLHLRFLYRLFTEKGMWKRHLSTYPKWIVTYPIFLLFKLKVNK